MQDVGTVSANVLYIHVLTVAVYPRNFAERKIDGWAHRRVDRGWNKWDESVGQRNDLRTRERREFASSDSRSRAQKARKFFSLKRLRFLDVCRADLISLRRKKNKTFDRAPPFAILTLFLTSRFFFEKRGDNARVQNIFDYIIHKYFYLIEPIDIYIYTGRGVATMTNDLFSQNLPRKKFHLGLAEAAEVASFFSRSEETTFPEYEIE